MLLETCEKNARSIVGLVENPTYSVLVVDDDEYFRALTRLLLSPNCEITEAASALECLQILRTRRFDAIILDLVMPEHDGIEALGQIKRLAPATKIVTVSGATDAELYLTVARQLGAHATLSKASVAALRNLLDVVLDSWRDDRQSEEEQRAGTPPA